MLVCTVRLYKGMGLFLAGSALCGLSQDMTQLIVFRAIQGIGLLDGDGHVRRNHIHSAVIWTSASGSGYVLTPLMLSLIGSSIIGGRLITKLSFRIIVVTSMAIMTAGYFFISQMTVDTTYMVPL